MKETIIREIKECELNKLLELYQYLHESDEQLPEKHEIENVWMQIQSDKNIVINSTSKINEYIHLIEQQSSWNNKTDFIGVLQSENIGFDFMNLLIYFHTESSGSIGVFLAEPIWEDENAVVNIIRTVPEVGTDDMAYYAYAFKVNKTIPKIIFAIGDTRVEIQNNDL